MKQQQPDFNDLWIQHQRRNTKTTQSWACLSCLDRKIFSQADNLWNHAKETHQDELPKSEDDWEMFRSEFEANSVSKRPDHQRPLRKPAFTEASTAQPNSLMSKRPLRIPAHSRSLSELKTLSLGGTQQEGEDVSMRDISDKMELPRKRAAIGDGISAGSASPLPFRDSESPPPRRSKARPTSAPYGSSAEAEGQKTLWTPDQEPLTRSSFNPSNIASVEAQKSRIQALNTKSRKVFRPDRKDQLPSQLHTCPSAISGKKPDRENQNSQHNDEAYDIVMQPETRPISQEQLVAEVKGIYAGLVMVEAKCIEVDNKQATLAIEDHKTQAKLNNEQWQALIALHRTLLHEHHDFFLASQHPSASPALRRLASKYAMPARMWRHGIHSFLELLRHRLPASLDHTLAFIYLAYSMMALLYETIPAFEDTWVECLGDLGRYRMAIEGDDIRDREVWIGVARHWYSKTSDRSPRTSRLYHHLAILAQPSAHDLLFFNNRHVAALGSRAQDFRRFSDNHIGRVTRKFMEQGYYIADANNVTRFGFASKDPALLCMSSGDDAQKERASQDPQEWTVSEAIDDRTRQEIKETVHSFTAPEAPIRAQLPCDPPLPNNSPLRYLLDHGTMHGYQRHPQRYFKSHHQASLESLLHSGLNGLGTVSRKISRILTRLLNSPLKLLLIIGLSQTVSASPINTSSGGVEAEGDSGDLAPRNVVPVLSNLVECFVLFVAFLAIFSWLEHLSSIFWITVASVLASMYLGMDERVSTSALVPVCAFSAGLVIHYHGKKLAPFKTTAATTGTIAVVVDFIIMEAVRQLSPEFEGRYQSFWIYHMVADLPTALVLGWLWEVFMVKPGHAQRFENAYLEPALPTNIRDTERLGQSQQASDSQIMRIPGLSSSSSS